MDSLTTIYEGRVPLPGGGTAVYNYSGVAWYRHADWLGSSRFGSTPTQTLYNDLAFAPFGEVYASTGSTDESFAGNNDDTSAGLYDAQYREYGIQGRWPSPDPAGMAVANPANPQTWNRYAYVMNNPLVFTDPSGFGTGGCFVAGRQGGGVSNYGNCGPADNGTYCEVDGAIEPCGGGGGDGGGSGGGGGGFDSVADCTGDTYFAVTGGVGVNANCTYYLVPTGTGSPSGGDLCDGGDCFDDGGGPGSPGNPMPQSPKSPDDVENCKVKAYINADAAAADLYSLRNQFKTPLKAAVVGTVSGAVTGCVTTVEVGCVEAAVPGAIVGFLGGLLEGSAVQLYHNYVGTRQIINQLTSDLAACGGG